MQMALFRQRIKELLRDPMTSFMFAVLCSTRLRAADSLCQEGSAQMSEVYPVKLIIQPLIAMTNCQPERLARRSMGDQR